jgi:hypothetical protein
MFTDISFHMVHLRYGQQVFPSISREIITQFYQQFVKMLKVARAGYDNAPLSFHFDNQFPLSFFILIEALQRIIAKGQYNRYADIPDRLEPFSTYFIPCLTQATECARFEIVRMVQSAHSIPGERESDRTRPGDQTQLNLQQTLARSKMHSKPKWFNISEKTSFQWDSTCRHMP